VALNGGTTTSEVARALASDPRLLLLDEPAGGMTPVEVEDLNQLIRKIRESGVTVVLVEHHVRLVMRVSDVVTVLDAGRVIATGPPDRVRRDPRVIAAYLGREA
jgi:branched-chain amino acid transport system ATP-binding protein